MFKKITCWIVLLYGLLLTTLGYIGFHNTGSRPSLIMGMGFGLLMIITSRLLAGHKKIGVYLAILGTIMLTVTFALRFHTTGKMVPGLMAIVSAMMLALFAFQLLNKKKKH